MGKRYEQITTAGALGLVALAWQGTAAAQLHLNGYLEYQARSERREGGTENANQIGTLRLDGWSYLGTPWLGDLSGGLGLSLSRTHEGDLGQSGREVTGAARLRLLPRTKLPFEAFVEKRDSRIDGELVGPSYVQTQYGFKQSYLPSATTRLTLNAMHTTQDTQANRQGTPAARSTSDFAGLALTKAFGEHQIDARSELSEVSRDTPEQRSRTTLNLLRHRYSAGSDFSLDTLATAVSSSMREATEESGAEQVQWNSNLFWRPDTERPSFVTASLLALQVDPTKDSRQSQTTTLAASGNYSYQLRPSLSLRSSASMTENKAQDTENTVTLVRAGATYAPPEIALRRYVYRYAAGAEVGRTTDDLNGSSQSVSVNLNHGLGQTRPLWRGNSAFNLNQQLASIYDTRRDLENTLAHSLTLDWNRNEDNTSVYARLLASDTRRIDGQDYTFDLINAQASGVYQASRYTVWSANLTYQLSRSTSDGTSSPWLTSASGYLNYQRDRLFGVRLLRFTSELRALTDDLAVVSTDSTTLDRRETLSWTNRLDYIVGRTQTSLRAALSEVDGRRYTVVQFLLRRYFGRLPQ